MKGKLSIVKVLASSKRQYRTSKSWHANQVRSQKLTKVRYRRPSYDNDRVRVRLKSGKTTKNAKEEGRSFYRQPIFYCVTVQVKCVVLSLLPRRARVIA